MRKLSLAIILPTLSVCVAAVFLKWGTAISLGLGLLYSPVGDLRHLCYSFNAPALLVQALELHWAPARWLPSRLLGAAADHIIFLVEVALLWFFVGRTLDNMRDSRIVIHRRLTPGRLLIVIFLTLWGIRLFFAAIEELSITNFQNQRLPSFITNGVIVAIWAIILIFIAARMLWSSRRPLPTS
ncbi:MAG: hypothetical protein WBX12_11720 [Candidatus Acidiferrales bacterium]